MIWIAITTAFCSCRYRTHLYLAEQAGAREHRCWQGTPCQLGPWGLPSWGAAALSFLFFPFLVEWRKPSEWLFSTDVYSNVIGLGLMRSSSSVKSAQSLEAWPTGRPCLFSLGHPMSLDGFGQGSRGRDSVQKKGMFYTRDCKGWSCCLLFNVLGRCILMWALK